MLVKCIRCLLAAVLVAGHMPAMDAVTVQAVANTYAQQGDYKQAVGLLDTWLIAHEADPAVEELVIEISYCAQRS